jgi:hypothetical protein
MDLHSQDQRLSHGPIMCTANNTHWRSGMFPASSTSAQSSQDHRTVRREQSSSLLHQSGR